MIEFCLRCSRLGREKISKLGLCYINLCCVIVTHPNSLATHPNTLKQKGKEREILSEELGWRAQDFCLPNHDPNVPNCLLYVYFLNPGDQEIHSFLVPNLHYNGKMRTLCYFVIGDDLREMKNY